MKSTFIYLYGVEVLQMDLIKMLAAARQWIRKCDGKDGGLEEMLRQKVAASNAHDLERLLENPYIDAEYNEQQKKGLKNLGFTAFEKEEAEATERRGDCEPPLQETEEEAETKGEDTMSNVEFTDCSETCYAEEQKAVKTVSMRKRRADMLKAYRDAIEAIEKLHEARDACGIFDLMQGDIENMDDILKEGRFDDFKLDVEIDWDAVEMKYLQ